MSDPRILAMLHWLGDFMFHRHVRVTIAVLVVLTLVFLIGNLPSTARGTHRG